METNNKTSGALALKKNLLIPLQWRHNFRILLVFSPFEKDSNYVRLGLLSFGAKFILYERSGQVRPFKLILKNGLFNQVNGSWDGCGLNEVSNTLEMRKKT